MRWVELEQLRLIMKTEAHRCRLLRKALKKSRFSKTFQKELSNLEKELRSIHLAYGFLRDVSYSRMEQTCKTLPNWQRVREISVQHSSKEDSSVQVLRGQILRNWKPELEERFLLWRNS